MGLSKELVLAIRIIIRVFLAAQGTAFLGNSMMPDSGSSQGSNSYSGGGDPGG